MDRLPRLQLDLAQGVFGALGGYGGGAKGTIVFKVWVQVDGHEYECRLHADLSGQERILGRDVLNGLEILFRGNFFSVATKELACLSNIILL